MPPLGPIAAFEPALDRTRAILFRPFHLLRSWKLAFFAYLALGGCCFLPYPLVLALLPHTSFSAILWVAAAAFSLLAFVLFYLGSRPQFVLFDLVLTLQPRIVPLWRLRQPSLIWRWIAIKLAITLPLALILLLPLGPVLRRLFQLLPQSLPSRPGADIQPPSFDPNLLVAIASSYAILAAVLALLFFVSSLLSDFVLPLLALENATAATALRRAVTILRSHPAAILGFLAFQILLTLVGLIAQYIAGIVLSLVAAIPLLLLALLGYFILHAIAPPAVLVVGGVLLYAVFFLITMYLQLGSFGALMIFLRAYSLFFVAGHYPPLTYWIYPAAPPPPLSGNTPPPSFLPTPAP